MVSRWPAATAPIVLVTRVKGTVLPGSGRTAGVLDAAANPLPPASVMPATVADVAKTAANDLDLDMVPLSEHVT
jgi:hypothetical protein